MQQKSQLEKRGSSLRYDRTSIIVRHDVCRTDGDKVACSDGLAGGPVDCVHLDHFFDIALWLAGGCGRGCRSGIAATSRLVEAVECVRWTNTSRAPD